MTSRVVVTGLGAVSGWGAGVRALWEGLLSGRSAIGPVSGLDLSRHRTHLAAEVDDLPTTEPGSGGNETGRHLSRCDRFALAAAREAVGQASLQSSALEAAGAFFGSSTGGMLEFEELYGSLVGALPGRPRLSRLANQQYNAPGDAVARHLGIWGPVTTLSSACTSGALALIEAWQSLRSGEVEVALAGGSDSLCHLTYAGFNALRAMDPEPCRPFRADRAGMSLGEGAAVLVLETLEHAQRRGARPLAELLAGVSTCDAHHMTAPSPTGEGASRAISLALTEAGARPEEVDFVNAHGTGTALNDAAEWRALETAFGTRARELPLTAPKSSVGHLLGAAGAIEAVATVLCLMAAKVHPTAGEGAVDPATPARLVLGEPLEQPLRLGLSINLAFGGSNAALLLQRWEGG